MGNCCQAGLSDQEPEDRETEFNKPAVEPPDNNAEEPAENASDSESVDDAMNALQNGLNTFPQTVTLFENMSDKEREKNKKTIALLLELFLTQIKRTCVGFAHWDVPKDIIAICIMFCEAVDGTLHMKPNSFIQLNANYEYVFQDLRIGESCTLSAKQNDAGKAKMTIFCLGNIHMSPFSYIHLNETLQLSTYIGYAIYIEAFGDIIMESDSHIDIDSDNASIFIKCKKLIMKERSSINAKNGQNMVLVITDEEWEQSDRARCLSSVHPAPQIFSESPTEALGNIHNESVPPPPSLPPPPDTITNIVPSASLDTELGEGEDEQEGFVMQGNADFGD